MHSSNIQKNWTLVAGLGVFSLLGLVLSSDVTGAKPKGTSSWLLCKCTCRAEDELGKVHEGPSSGVWYTTSHADCDVLTTCKVGRLDGLARDCTGTQQSGVRGVANPPTAGNGGTATNPPKGQSHVSTSGSGATKQK